MARISISLPDSLMAKLDPIKDGINVSQLCREALEQRVAAYQRASNLTGNDLDFQALVLRLRGERKLFGGKFEQLGKDNAAAWLAIASYLEIQDVAEHGHSNGMLKYKLPRAAFNAMKQDMQELKLSCDGAQAVVYKTAWLDCVKAIWSEVVDRGVLDRKEEPRGGQATHSE